MFKSLIPAVVILSALAAPSFASAQEAGLTRAQVRAELVQLEKAGYNPSSSDHATYPAQLQAAESRVASEQGQAAYGGVANGSSASGSRAPVQTGPQSVYFGH
jgi:hypothetical protein